MIQAPWDDRLWSLLSTEPDKITSQVIQENLRKRKCFRNQPEKSGTDKDPLVLRPPSGEWRGEYQDMKTHEQYEVKYRITFLEDGRVQGSAISTDGDQALQDFKINGVHSLRTGIVAWSQFPSQPRPNAQASEFYGDAFMGASGPARITGTFVTPSGRYCVVNLAHPKTTKGKEVDKAQVAVTFNLPISEELPRHSSEELPTLLTVCRTPIKSHIANNLKDGRPAFFPKGF
jgi:hypothetical protein